MPKKNRTIKKKLTLKERRRRTAGIKLFALSLLVLTFCFSLWYAMRYPSVVISQVSVTGTYYAREELVKKVVTDMLSGSYYYLVPRRNAFFYPKESIERELLSLFIPIKKVLIVREGFTALSVTVEERIPDTLWCSSFEDNAPCYFMDDSGLVFVRANDATSSPLVRLTGLLSSQPLGETYLNERFKNFYATISGLKEAARRTPTRVAIDDYHDATVWFLEGGKIMFTEDAAGDVLLENITTVFGSKRFDTTETLEYADFRFGNKIYVKLVGE